MVRKVTSATEAALCFGCEAGFRINGSQVLVRTFCSHLAMRGVAPTAIHELVAHSTLGIPVAIEAEDVHGFFNFLVRRDFADTASARGVLIE